MEQVKFCGTLKYGHNNDIQETGGDDATAIKTQMRYNNIFFSFESTLQIAIVECKFLI